MSGIAGYVNVSGKSLDPAVIARLCDGMQRRGPGALSQWRSADAALMYLHVGHGPAQHTFDAMGAVMVVGDIRIDNRDTVIRDLGLAPSALLTDAELIAAAWIEWGKGMSARLIGDFACAVVDREKNRVFLLRDALGVRPLFWKWEGSGVSFASDARILGGDMQSDPNDAHLGAFLVGTPLDSEETVYDGVRRVKPAHWVDWCAGTTHIKRYWQLDLREHSPSRPETAFRDIFKTAVKDRISVPETTASMLSGGLDSSSICVVANALTTTPLRTYSLTYPDHPEADETPYIDTVLASGAYDPVLLPITDSPPFEAVDDILIRQGGPFEAPGLTKSARLFKRVAADGYTVLLSGHGGDEVAWTGVTRVIELASQRRFLRAIPLVPAYARATGTSSAAVMVALLRTFGRPSRATARIYGALARRLRKSQTRAARSLQDTYLEPAFLRRLKEAMPDSDPTDKTDPQRHLDRSHHVAALTAPLIPRAFEILDTEAAAAGIELRFPFYDRRLVAFCVALPAHEKFRRGESRSILRRALRGMLPARIAERQSKTDFAGEMAQRLVRHHDDILDDVVHDATGGLGVMLNMAAVRDAIAALRRDPAELGGRDIMFLWRVTSLHIWMTMTKQTETGERQ